MLDEQARRRRAALAQIREQLLGLSAEMFEIRPGGKRCGHVASMHRPRSANRPHEGRAVVYRRKTKVGSTLPADPEASFTPDASIPPQPAVRRQHLGVGEVRIAPARVRQHEDDGAADALRLRTDAHRTLALWKH